MNLSLCLFDKWSIVHHLWAQRRIISQICTNKYSANWEITTGKSQKCNLYFFFFLFFWKNQKRPLLTLSSRLNFTFVYSVVLLCKQTFFRMCQIQMEFRKKCFSILKNCFQLNGVLFWYNWWRNYYSNLQGNSLRIKQFYKNTINPSQKASWLYQHSVKYVTF